MEREPIGAGLDFVNAKVHGMRSKLFESDRLLPLTEIRTLPDLFRRIYPSDTFSGHVEFERRLATDAVEQLARISLFTSGKLFDLLRWLLTHYEVENLKIALRHFIAGDSLEAARAQIVPTSAWFSLRLERLFEAHDLLGFARAVRVPELHDALLDTMRKAETPDLTDLEMALDSAYLKRLAQLGLSKGPLIRNLTAFDVDTRNLMLLLRARFNFNRTFSQIDKLIAPADAFLTRGLARRIDSAPGRPEAIAMAVRSFLPADARDGVETVVQLEDAIALQQYRLATRCFAESVLDKALVVAYFYIKRAELANMIRITEGIRHGLGAEELEKELLTARR